MFDLRVEKDGDKILITVLKGEEAEAKYELRMKDMHDRSPAQTAFNSAEGIFRGMVLAWIANNTPIRSV